MLCLLSNHPSQWGCTAAASQTLGFWLQCINTIIYCHLAKNKKGIYGVTESPIETHFHNVKDSDIGCITMAIKGGTGTSNGSLCFLYFYWAKHFVAYFSYLDHWRILTAQSRSLRAGFPLIGAAPRSCTTGSPWELLEMMDSAACRL